MRDREQPCDERSLGLSVSAEGSPRLKKNLLRHILCIVWADSIINMAINSVVVQVVQAREGSFIAVDCACDQNGLRVVACE